MTPGKDVRGKLLWWNDDKGFGIIGRDRNPDHNVFIHFSAFSNGERPEAGDTIKFSLGNNPHNGKEKAIFASIVE